MTTRETVTAGRLECTGVEVAYGSVQVLFGVDLVVEPGEVVALLGTNGAGKSTLLKAVSGLLKPIAGSIKFDDAEIGGSSPAVAVSHGIVQVPGGKAIFPTLSVAEHFSAGTWTISGRDDVQARIEEVCDSFPRVRERWDQPAGNLSGGEQQQLALAMAFVLDPRLLIIDELSLGLAPTVVEQLLELVKKINATGCSILIVEQSVNVALTIADRAYFMEKGEVRFEGETEELLDRPDVLKSVFLAGATRKSSRPKAVEIVDANTEQIPVVTGSVLDARGVSKSYGGISAVYDVDFTVAPQEIVGIIGPNGAGKTTFLDLVSGHQASDSGRIELMGVDISEFPADKRARLGLGRSFQDARIFPALTVAENIAIGLDRHIVVKDHLSAVFDLPAARDAEADVAWTVDDLIELMSLGAYRSKFVGELSTGSRRIVDLAMAIAHDPVVLLLDEPSSGIAQKEAEALVPLLHRIRDQAGCAIVLIEHDMPLISSVADELVAMELGRVVVRDRPDAVLTHPRVVEAYLGGEIAVINRSGTRKSKARR